MQGLMAEALEDALRAVRVLPEPVADFSKEKAA
jgi:hypothetical protein